MGYTTEYNLDWNPMREYAGQRACQHEFSSKFCPECGASSEVFDLDNVVAKYIEDHEDMPDALNRNGESEGPCHWRSYEEDMIAMSQAIPHVTFTLTGKGEDSDDIWVEYYRDGKMQRHKLALVLTPIDETKWVYP